MTILLSIWNNIVSLTPITLEQGLSYALVALGIALTFRILSFPDLTVDGSFPLGGAIAARLIVEGVGPHPCHHGGRSWRIHRRQPHRIAQHPA